MTGEALSFFKSSKAGFSFLVPRKTNQLVASKFSSLSLRPKNIIEFSPLVSYGKDKGRALKKEFFNHLSANFLNIQNLNDAKPLQEMQYALQKAVTALIDNSQKTQS